MKIQLLKDNILKKECKFISYQYYNLLILFTNIFVLIFNIYFLLSKVKINPEEKRNNIDSIMNKITFRNIDKVIFNFLLYSYSKIGKYLNNKYNNYNKNSDLKFYKRKHKKLIRLYALNLGTEKGFKKNMLFIVKNKFYIKIDKYKPDYLFYGVFGNDEENKIYDNSIKIAVYTENTIPDLSSCDYAIGHAHISYFDRYLMFPFCFLSKLKETTNLNLIKIRNNVISNPRKKFCAALITNVSPFFTDYFRLKFINELNKYKKVDMGGRYKNSVGGNVNNKTEFLSNYKFSIAMENTNGDGYISEKIVESFISGTIPIYYGSYMIEEYINPKSFILINGPQDMYEKIEYIKKIDNDDKLYKSILKEKVYIEEKIVEKSLNQQSDFLIHIFEQEKNKAKRK